MPKFQLTLQGDRYKVKALLAMVQQQRQAAYGVTNMDVNHQPS